MEPISSIDNPHVKLARSLHESKGRRLHGAFLVEGVRLVEAASERAVPRLVLHTEALLESGERARRLVDRLTATGAPVRGVTERVMAHVADTVTPQGIAAVMPLPVPAPPRDGTPLDLILDEIGDPGNAGTLLRTAAAAGVTRVLAAPGTVDLYSPKVVRAGAGAHFVVPVSAATWDGLSSRLDSEIAVYVADAHAPALHWDVDWTGPSALIVSNEARGASAGARRLATRAISIPMTAGVESLNAAIAGSVILYEALRQRTHPTHRTSAGGTP